MKTRRFVIIIALLTLVLALAGGFTMLWRFFIFQVVYIGLSFLWLRLNASHISGEVGNTRDYFQAGERFEEEFKFSNSSRMPTTLIEVSEGTDIPGYRNNLTFSLGSRGNNNWRTEVACRRRGKYSLGRVTARVTDPLGLFSIKREYGKEHSIIVYPTTLDLSFFDVLPRLEPGSSRRRWLSTENSPNASRVREYISGDRLRSIHWHTTAHTGNLMVKEFDPDTTNVIFRDIWIVLDMQRTSQYGEGTETTEEYGVTIAASLAKKYIENGKNVGFLTLGNQPFMNLPETGEAQFQNIMYALAMVKATGEQSVESLVMSQEERFDTGSAIIIITAADIRRTGNTLGRIVQRGTTITTILLDSVSFGGKVAAVDIARGLIAGGVHVYIVRRGVEIARALDNRFLYLPAFNPVLEEKRS
jgi:uncharacterized protein (DUF58 family)